ncbi:MAG: ribose 5-phosphate isomerase B [Flavobacteriales bacterium]|nr:ribose 5-phosphate isomerase B [Flavobacteriales bacterium]
MKTIAIGCDHAGFQLKTKLIDHLRANGYSVEDKGTYSEESTDYPDYAHAVSKAVENNEVDLGILLCGSGNGISMAANKHQGIRAALCWMPEIASLARLHNNANVLSIPARYVSDEQAIEILDTFLNTSFEGGRHERRVNKIACS